MSHPLVLGMFGMPGHLELLIIGFIILILFGHRLPSLMRSLGRGVVEFKHGLHGVGDDEDEMDDVPAKSKSQKEGRRIDESEDVAKTAK